MLASSRLLYHHRVLSSLASYNGANVASWQQGGGWRTKITWQIGRDLTGPETQLQRGT